MSKKGGRSEVGKTWHRRRRGRWGTGCISPSTSWPARRLEERGKSSSSPLAQIDGWAHSTTGHRPPTTASLDLGRARTSIVLSNHSSSRRFARADQAAASRSGIKQPDDIVWPQLHPDQLATATATAAARPHLTDASSRASAARVPFHHPASILFRVLWAALSISAPPSGLHHLSRLIIPSFCRQLALRPSRLSSCLQTRARLSRGSQAFVLFWAMSISPRYQRSLSRMILT